jgi:hypothetical protein
MIKTLQRRRVDTGLTRNRGHIAGGVLSREQRPGGTAGMLTQEFLIEVLMLRQPAQQSIEQHNIAPRPKRQVQVGDVAGGGASRINHHQAQRGPLLLRPDNALIQHRMAPGGI